ITRNGALAGMIVGSLTIIIWKQIHGGVFDLYGLLPGFILAWLAIILVSKLGNTNFKKTQTVFDEVHERLKPNLLKEN
ncbi:MAG: sodium:proline symporter, partial [Thiovulaceae bacterium]|nr:sodium:proline symporter [Sulfurimonadaceae bacterium]